METSFFKNQRVAFYAWSGHDTQTLVAATVIRLNPKTVTVRTEHGVIKRIAPHLLRLRDWLTEAERGAHQ